MLCVCLNQITPGTQDVNTSISNVSSHIYKLFSYKNITLHSLEKKKKVAHWQIRTQSGLYCIKAACVHCLHI